MNKRYSVFGLILILAILLSSFGTQVAYSAADSNGKVRVFVQFEPGKKAAVERALSSAGGEFHFSFDELETFSVTLPAAALAAIEHNPNVVMVEEDAPRYLIGINQSTIAEVQSQAAGQTVPYGVDMVQARDVWDANRDGNVDAGAPTGSNRTICIIDSGLYTGHEDLQGLNVLGGYTSIDGGWDSDGNGHGSHVAGTIAAMNNALGVVGVTPGTVKLYIVRVFGDDGVWAYSSSLVDAANRCASGGANIISMSLGGSRAVATERRAFDNLYSQGILSIAAAGNDGTTGLSYPASYDAVISVAAIDSNKVVANFSQKNAQVEVAAPGVGVLSTIPYNDYNTLTVGAITYTGGHIEFSARGTVAGTLVDGGRCAATNAAWAGKAVLCERGDITFLDKVKNVENSGGATAILYNNVSGGFSGTLGDGNTSAIVAISLSQEDGQLLVATSLGQSGSVHSERFWPVSNYEYYDGTSMATPHVSAVVALIWSSKPNATNAEIRAVLQQTAEDLGAAGRDNSYGFGLVRAKAAIDALGGGGTTVNLHISDLDKSTTSSKSGWKAIVTVTVVNASGAAVSGAIVDGTFNGSAASCTTGANGQCALTASLRNNVTSVTFTVTNVTASGFSYDAAANSDPDGDSNGTSITINKP